MTPVAVLGDTQEAKALRRLLGVDAGAARMPGCAAMIDAGHWFAPATPPADLPLLRLRRPLWRAPYPGAWIEAADPEALRAALPPHWRRALIAIGRDRLSAFEGDAERWYLVRVRGGGAVTAGLTHFDIAAEAGPFTVASEMALLRERRVDAVIARNEGGTGAWPKIEAAMELGLGVALLSPPPLPQDAPSVETVEAAAQWARRFLRPTTP